MQARRLPLHQQGRASKFLFGAIALLIAFPVGAQELQSWNEVDIAWAWHSMDLLVPFVARTDPSLPNPQLAATGLTADLHLPLGLTLTPGYLFADLPQPSYAVHLPLLAVTESIHPGRLTVADRNRFEKLFGYPGSPVRYRNRLLFDLPFGARRRAHVFLDDELMVNLTTGSFNQNRLQSGAGYRFTPHLLLDVYYLQKNPASGAATYVAGSTLRVTLTRATSRMTPTHNP